MRALDLSRTWGALTFFERVLGWTSEVTASDNQHRYKGKIMGLTCKVCFSFFYDTLMSKDNAVSNHFWIPSNMAFLLPRLVKRQTKSKQKTIKKGLCIEPIWKCDSWNNNLYVRFSLKKMNCLFVVFGRTDAVINPSSNKFVSTIRLQVPDVSKNLGDLIDSLAVNDSLSSTGKVQKNVGKLVTVEPMGEKLYSELCIQTLVWPLDELKVSFEETKTFADSNCQWPRLECCSETHNRYWRGKVST